MKIKKENVRVCEYVCVYMCMTEKEVERTREYVRARQQNVTC